MITDVLVEGKCRGVLSGKSLENYLAAEKISKTKDWNLKEMIDSPHVRLVRGLCGDIVKWYEKALETYDSSDKILANKRIENIDWIAEALGIKEYAAL